MKQALCCFSVNKCADLQPLWEGHFTALWGFFDPGFSESCRISTELQQILHQAAGLPGQAVGAELAPAGWSVRCFLCFTLCHLPGGSRRHWQGS